MNKQTTARNTATILTQSLNHHHPNNSQNIILCFLLWALPMVESWEQNLWKDGTEKSFTLYILNVKSFHPVFSVSQPITWLLWNHNRFYSPNYTTAVLLPRAK
jgi:hypothetical protein